MREWRSRTLTAIGFAGRVYNKICAVSKPYLDKMPTICRLPWGSLWLTSNDVMSRHVRFHEDFEENEKKFMRRFLQSGMIVLDLGAHHGYYTLMMSFIVGNNGRVIAFEPSPRERRRLKLHLAINRCSNVRVESWALGSSEGVADLYVCLEKETGCNSLRPPAVSERTRAVQVYVTTLDSYMGTAGINTTIDFIKIDVEGAEVEVMKGATGLLSQSSRPVIMAEIDDLRSVPWGYRSAEIYDFIVSKGFRLFEIDSEGKLNPCPRKENFDENLVAVPIEKLDLMAPYLG